MGKLFSQFKEDALYLGATHSTSILPTNIMKRVLVVHYSQTGQLSAAVTALCRPLKENNKHIALTHEYTKPEHDYPFPWPFLDFFDVFPESVYMDAPNMMPSKLTGKENFDLIIIAYQVWFLSPSLPIVGFIKSKLGQQLLKGKPVITLIACRNMWLNAHKKMGQLLTNAGSHHCDNIVLTDSNSSLITFITTPRWLLTGKKDSWGPLPSAGVSQQDIDGCSRFGKALAQALQRDDEKRHTSMLHGLRAATVDTQLIASEMAGHRSFLVWGKLLRGIGKQGQARRKPFLVLYVLFLITLIVTIVPITIVTKKLLQPLLVKKLNQKKELFELPSGSKINRMNEFT